MARALDATETRYPEGDGAMTQDLTLSDLVAGLERLGSRYKTLDVIAWNVRELREALESGTLGELTPIDASQPGRAWYGFQRNGVAYQLKVHESGVARLTRAATAGTARSSQLVTGGASGLLATSKELPEIILGFLIGAALDASPGIARHALTIRYDEQEKQWRAYDGPLARWMREKALHAEPAFA
jgi:hypothetical protein